MTDISLDATRESFLFREPLGFFDEFEKKDEISDSLLQSLLTFRANLHSAVLVGVIPFQWVQSGVLDQRFNQLVIAANIHNVPIGPETEDEENERKRISRKSAIEQMNSELRDPEVITRHAWSTVNVLKKHLIRNDFQMSAQELLRQIIVMCWGALEIVANDALRVVLNSKPTVFRDIIETRPYRDAFSSRVIIEALETNGFDLSGKMGDVFCDVIRIDALDKIRNICSLVLADALVDAALKSEPLWRIFQQRNLIVHRRGLIDTWYLENTADSGTIGAHITFNASYVEVSLNVVRDAGFAIIKGCHRKLTSA
jgi:hypothetical protein